MTPTRDPRLIANGIVALAATAALVWLGATRGGWWELAWLFALLAAIAAAGNIADGATRRTRDTKETP